MSNNIQSGRNATDRLLTNATNVGIEMISSNVTGGGGVVSTVDIIDNSRPLNATEVINMRWYNSVCLRVHNILFEGIKGYIGQFFCRRESCSVESEVLHIMETL